MTQAAVTAKVQYRIGGMACGFCVASIGKAIGRMPGVKSVHVNLAHEETLIEFDPGRVTPQKFEQTLNELGYTVRKLLALVPPRARVVRDGAQSLVPLGEVRPGELVRVRPGESIPVDGVVVNMPLLTWPGGRR